MTSADEDEEEMYDVLFPKREIDVILNQSDFYSSVCPKPTIFGEALYRVSSSLPMRGLEKVSTLLLHRFTNIRYNWQTQPLRSFLELVCWISVMYASLNAYGNLIWAIQFGTLVGMFMSICDEIAEELCQSLLYFLTQHSEGRHVLKVIGFDLTKDGRLIDGTKELNVFTTLLFGSIGVAIMTNLPDFTIYMATVGTALVISGQLFAMWLPTRRIGLTIQSRWTNMEENWTCHFWRSLIELVCCLGSMIAIYIATHNFFLSVQLSAWAGIIICLLTELEPITDAEWRKLRADQDARQMGNAIGEAMYSVSSWLVSMDNLMEEQMHAFLY